MLAELRDVLAAELGRPSEAVFAALDPMPVASTPLVRVHRARLREGGDVLVRVARPDAAEPIDMRRELAHLNRLRNGLDERTFERVPRPYPDLCTERVLVTERLEGTLLADVLAALESGRDEHLDRLDALGLDPRRLAGRMVAVTLTQAFRTGLYCADVDPANVMVLPGDLLTFVDYARCGVVDLATSDAQLAHLTAVCDDHGDGMLEPPVDRAELPAGSDLGRLRSDLLRAIRRRSAGDAGPPVGDFLTAVLEAAAARHVPLAEGTALLYRTFAAVEQAARRLDAGCATATARRTLRCLQLERALRKFEPRSLQPTLVSLLGLLHDGPIQAQKLLADLTDGSFALNVSVADAPRTALVRDGHVRLVVVAIAAVGLAVAATAPHLPSVAGVSLGWPLGALLAGVYGWLFLALRRLR